MDFLSNVKNKDLKKDLGGREYKLADCDKPTRKGYYLHFRAKGLSPGFTWFVGTDENGNYVEEFLA